MKAINVRWQYNSVEVAVNRNISLYETGLSPSLQVHYKLLKLLDQVLQLNTAELVHHMKPWDDSCGQWLGETGSLLGSQRGTSFQTHAWPWFQLVEEHKVKQLWIMKNRSNVEIVKITHTYNIEWTYTDFDLCVELNL